ncbi:MAG: hypothetical protein KJ052_12845 [Candidatus Hydrogenedentes bacterium]|nr:hypothetical protein [Candidatus Hydrogenedentota bacterium]
MKSQVTTKQGDGGQSRTLDGETVSKADPIMECAGCVDEARTQTALLRLHVIEAAPEHTEEYDELLVWLLHAYFLIGTTCSDPRNRKPEHHKRAIQSKDIERLERYQAIWEERTPLPKAFILSATNTLSARADIVCTIVRRLERAIVRLKETVPEFQAEVLLVFVNRLSDTLFIMARRLEAGKHLTVDYALLD